MNRRLLLTIIPLIASAQLVSVSGRLIDYSASGDVQVLRNGKTLKTEILMDFASGDSIKIRTRDGFALMMGFVGRPVKLCSPDSILDDCDARLSYYVVPRTAGPPPLTAIMKGWLSSWLGDAQQERVRLEPKIRAEAPTLVLDIPMLRSADSRVAAGKHRLYLGWIGGKPPFQVHIVQTRSTTTILRRTAEDRTIELDFEVLPGIYSAEVHDSNSASVTRHFLAVDRRQAPMKSFAMLSTDLTPVATAAWLSSQDNGSWLLEAYQVLEGAAQQTSIELARAALRYGITARPLKDE